MSLVTKERDKGRDKGRGNELIKSVKKIEKELLNYKFISLRKITFMDYEKKCIQNNTK